MYSIFWPTPVLLLSYFCQARPLGLEKKSRKPVAQMEFEISLKRAREPVASIGPLKNLETRTYCENIKYTKEKTEAVEVVPDAPNQESSESSDASESEDEDLTVDQFYKTYVKRTHEQCLVEFKAPQRSIAWLQARQHAITASSFGAASGNNKYSSPKACALDKLWSSFKGNAMTEYGTYHETDARDTFIGLLNTELKSTLEEIYGGPFDSFELHECGLLKHHEQPWMAVSPDGLLQLKGPRGSLWTLVEYKCPARLRHSTGHPYCTSPSNVPVYYMDQIQGIMGLLNKYPDLLNYICAGPHEAPKACFFVIWQPLQMHVTRVAYDEDYYTKSLEPALEKWFFERYLPLAALKQNGSLIDGTDTAASAIDASSN